MVFLEWLFFYFAVAAIGTFLSVKQKSPKNKLIAIHICLILSILPLNAAGVKLHWEFQAYALSIFLISAALCIFLMRRLSFVYIISSVIQELCLLLAGVLLGQITPVIVAACASSLVYACAHSIDSRRWQLILPLTFLWGTFSILLYNLFHQPMLNFALHIIGGAIFFRLGLIYEGLTYKPLIYKEN